MKRNSALAVLALASLATACAARSGAVGRAGETTGISETSVRSHMEFLASDAMNGRGSGTRDEWITATYIASHLRRWGLQPLGTAADYVQTVRIERSEAAAPPVLSFGTHRATHGKQMTVAAVAGTKVSGPLQKVTAESVVSPGSVLLLPEGTPAPSGSAAAAMVLSLESEQVRSRRVAGTPGRPLTVQWIVETRRRATIALDKETYTALAAMTDGTVVTLDTEVKPAQTSLTWNAAGMLRGTVASAGTIVLSAHMDHVGNRAATGSGAGDTIFNGADDDASGSIAVLELAQALARGERPRRTIIFTWFGSEEAGGIGSRFFIETSPVPLDTIVANLQFEMIGRADAMVPPHTLWLTGYERSNLGPELAKRGARLVQDPHPKENFFERSDNIQFARRGVIAHTVSSYGLHKEYHQPSDEIRFIDFPHMTDAIRSMLGPVRWLAGSDFRPAWLPGKKP